MQIGWIEVLRKAHGETAYADMAKSILSRHHELAVINLGVDHFHKYQYPKLLFRLGRVAGQKAIWIRNFDAIVTMPYDSTEGKNIAMVHHFDHSFQPFYFKPFWALLEKTFYRHLRKADAIVTVSKHWQHHFYERGFKKVYLIYNAFDLNPFHFEEEEVSAFRRKWQLEGKPIVYMGNCQAIKGVGEVYERLKDLDLHLVTSGRREVRLPARHLELNYRDYLLLLKSSSVVITMSKFREGWNRTAHEAMLCRTPVIGSGLGGMRELLEGGEQIICEDLDDLRGNVLFALSHPELGGKGYEYAIQFTLETFSASWLNVIENTLS